MTYSHLLSHLIARIYILMCWISKYLLMMVQVTVLHPYVSVILVDAVLMLLWPAGVILVIGQWVVIFNCLWKLISVQTVGTTHPHVVLQSQSKSYGIDRGPNICKERTFSLLNNCCTRVLTEKKYRNELDQK